MEPSPPALDPEELERYRQNHIGRLLQRAYRHFNTESLRRLHARGHPRLTLAHTAVLPQIDLRGTRSTLLAERGDMTKQAAGQLINELEARGYVRRRPDPHDGRASLVEFTELGAQFLRDAHEVKRELEGEYATVLGTEGLRSLQAQLTALVDGLTRQTPEGG